MLPVILSRFTILSQIASMDNWPFLSISFIFIDAVFSDSVLCV